MFLTHRQRTPHWEKKIISHFQFTKLIEEFCEYSGLDEPERIIHGGPIMFEGVTFSLIHSEEADPELMFIYCDFGEIEEGREAEVYRALLEANMFLYNGSGPLFTFSSETGRVILAGHCRLGETQPKTLQEILVKMSAQATAWQENQLFEAVA